MAKLTWDGPANRNFSYGVSNGVLYQWDGEEFTKGVPWNGLVSVIDKPSGKEKTPLYSGDLLKGYELSHEEYGGEIKAVTWPYTFRQNIGYKELTSGIYFTQQDPELFGFSYQVQFSDGLYRTRYPDIHLVYNCMVVDNVSFSHETYGGKQYEEVTFPFVTFPMTETGRFQPTTHIVFSFAHISNDYRDKYFTQLTNLLYGTDTSVAKMPNPADIVKMFTVLKPSKKLSTSKSVSPTPKSYVVLTKKGE